jgi:hypothetical protein
MQEESQLGWALDAHVFWPNLGCTGGVLGNRAYAVVVVNEYNPQAKASILNRSIPDWSRLPQSPRPIGCSHKAAQAPLQYNCKADAYGLCFYSAYAVWATPGLWFSN